MILNPLGPQASQVRSCGHGHHHHDHSHDVPTDGVAPGRTPEPGLMNVSPGVTPQPGTLKLNAAEAARLSAELATKAAGMGTFGVGGVLIDKDFHVLATSRNCVVDGTTVKDPTAHGERQLVDWYFQQVKNGVTMPPPWELTILTSLDPCCMCAGALMASGIRVATLAQDNFAGVDYKGGGQFSGMPEGLAEKAKDQFAYLGIEGARPYAGDPDGLYAGAAVPASVEKSSLDAFVGSLDTVKNKINSAGGDIAEVSASLPEGLRDIVRKYDAAGLSLVTDPNNPGPELAPVLLAKARQAQEAGNEFDAAALIDRNGKVILTVGGQEGTSPTRTAFMELTRTWARIRDEAGAEGQQHLPAFKHCRVVSLQGPGPEATSFMEFGAYGSSVEGPVPAGTTWQYVLPHQSQETTQKTLDNMPPLYSQVIKPQVFQVTNQDLIDACRS